MRVVNLIAAGSVGLLLFGPVPVQAQQGRGGGPAVAQVILGQPADPHRLVEQLLPIVQRRPEATAEIIAVAQANPAIAPVIAQALSRIHSIVAAQNPQAAAAMSNIIASAPPSFQSVFAAAQSADAAGFGGSLGGGGGGQSSAALGGFGFGTLGLGGSSGGGGVVSPSRP